jgi:Arc/MetJ family transcription regulator
MYIHAVKETSSMAVTMTSIRLDTQLADEAAKVLGVKSRTEAVHTALREIVALRRFKKLMKKNAGKLQFAGHGE